MTLKFFFDFRKNLLLFLAFQIVKIKNLEVYFFIEAQSGA